MPALVSTEMDRASYSLASLKELAGTSPLLQRPCLSDPGCSPFNLSFTIFIFDFPASNWSLQRAIFSYSSFILDLWARQSETPM